jgi:mono/diheme cytochrome c family protein
MMRPRALVMLAALALVAVAVIAAISQIKLDAISEPGPIETFLATQAKHVLIGWYSGNGIPPGPTDLQASIKEGDTLYGTDCSMCHGADGHTPTDNGRWMYPRASDLTSPEVGQYTDRELFWIIKNGIRLTGMPAFGKVESDENIWDLVSYVKTLRAKAQTGSADNHR